MIAFTSNTEIKTTKETRELLEELKALADKQVLVGVPEENNPRDDDPKAKLGNAALAAIHDTGSQRMNIPARPFMKPGIAKAQSKINKEMKLAASYFLAGNEEEADFALNRAGFHAQLSIQDIINRGEGFAPLKRATLLGRLRKRKYLWKYYHKPWMKDQKEAFLATLHPLVDTQAMLRSITYVVQRKMK